MFRPGSLSQPEADRLNSLWRWVEALRRLWVAPPASIVRGPDGSIGIQVPAGLQIRWVVVTDVEDLTDADERRYEAKEVERTADGEWEVKDPEVIYKNIVGLPSTPILATDESQYLGIVPDPDMPPDDAGEPFWRILHGGRPTLRGKLDGTLTAGSSQTVSVWRTDTSGTNIDTGENVTVYSWLMSSGSVASGKMVWANWEPESGRYVLANAECP